MTKIDNFKSFVRRNPNLITYVREKNTSWQEFYELYDLYGEDPTTTTEVLELTDDDTLPPSDSIISLALSLVILTKLPVKTKVLPLNSSFSSYPKLLI